MIKPVSILLCFLLAASAVLCGCQSEPEEETVPATEPVSQAATAAPTTAQPTTVAATSDSAQSDEGKDYDYVAIKKKSGEIISQFDKIVSDNKFKGSIYMKLGNDFEYLSSTGAANSNKHIDNSINTRFYVGDITKQFTAAAVLLLSEQGKLSLDDTIDKYFPDYEYGESITINHLLTMTSGIKTYVNHNDITTPSNYLNNELNDCVKEDNSAEENKELILDWILSQEPAFDAGTQYSQSESNYYLLGEIIGQASGESYYSYLETAIFKPLGMGSTGFEPNDKVAEPYEQGAITKSLNYNGVGYSAYGMISSVSDLLKWTDGLLNNQVLSADSFNLMFSDKLSEIKDCKKKCGFGVELSGKSASSSGRFDAYGAALIYNTDKSEIYISLTNYTESDYSLVRSSFKKSIQKYTV